MATGPAAFLGDAPKELITTAHTRVESTSYQTTVTSLLENLN